MAQTQQVPSCIIIGCFNQFKSEKFKEGCRSMRRIPVAEPVLRGNEKRYVQQCLETGWISGSGTFVDAFEEQFAAFCNTRYSIAVFNGTVALHLALLPLGIKEGDEVIVPDLTYIASANAVAYCHATPVFADIDPLTWTLDAQSVEQK